ncbi:MAG: DUF4145 domain-containing protein, partial [Candidatus Electrothrix sp. AR3]|nr:DUF4145 domain-containing protein [Candidatus Electrothrix sp. AR3]
TLFSWRGYLVMLEQFVQILRRLFPSFFLSTKDSETDVRRITIIAVCILCWSFFFAFLGGGTNACWGERESLATASWLTFCFGGINAWWWGSSSLAMGGFIGFLFGIPKVVQGSFSSGEQEANSKNYSQRVNTNLEQISDWLTKIIVGFGLIQMQKIPNAFLLLSEYVASHSQVSSSFAGALILFFAIIGFFTGYLATRLYLAAAFGRADQQNFQAGIQRLRDTTEKDTIGEMPQEVVDIIERSPSSAVTVAFRNFDYALHKATERLGLPIQKRTIQACKQLAQKGHFNRRQTELAEQLRQLRNIAVHEGDKKIKKNDAETYVRNAAQLTREIDLLGKQVE